MSGENGLVLYHSVESTCAQKVRLVLAEKSLAWDERRLNLRRGEQLAPQYLKLNPKGVVPTLVHRGRAIRESSVINEYLDETFPAPRLAPADTFERARMRLIVKTFDDEVHGAVGVLTYAILLRHQMNALKSPAELEMHFARMPDPMRRARQQAVHEQGLAAPAATAAVTTLARVLGELHAALAEGPWLAGRDFSLADAAAAPYVVRMEGLGLGPLIAGAPRVGPWLERVRARPRICALAEPWGSASFERLLAEHAGRAGSELAPLLAAAPI